MVGRAAELARGPQRVAAPGLVEGDIGRALDALGEIPVGLAVTDEGEQCHERSS